MGRDTPFWMLSLLGPTSMYFVLAALLIPFVLYMIARWRAHREQIVDPQLGMKVAFGYFASTAFQVACAGVALLLYAAVGDLDSDRGDAIRVAFGLLVPGALILAAHLLLLARSNDREFPAVRRLFVGYNLLLTGTVGFVGLVLGCEALFKSGSPGELGKIGGVLSLVYGGAWFGLGSWLVRSSPRTAKPDLVAGG